MTSAEAYKALTETMRKHSNFGTQDSEGYHALYRIDRAVAEGKPYPLTEREWPHDNPWELYESVTGWQQASAELQAAGREYWKASMAERLGVTISD